MGNRVQINIKSPEQKLIRKEYYKSLKRKLGEIEQNTKIEIAWGHLQEH